MSKNTRTDGFRRTDIDKFDEDKFKQETDAVEFDSSEVEAKKKESIALLNSQKKTDALRTLLSSPPLSYHSPQLQSVKVGCMIFYANTYQQDYLIILFMNLN